MGAETSVKIKRKLCVEIEKSQKTHKGKLESTDEIVKMHNFQSC